MNKKTLFKEENTKHRLFIEEIEFVNNFVQLNCSTIKVQANELSITFLVLLIKFSDI